MSAKGHVQKFGPSSSRVSVANSSDADALSRGVTRRWIVKKIAMDELRLGQLTELRSL